MRYILRVLLVLCISSRGVNAEPATVTIPGKRTAQAVEVPRVDTAIKAVLIGSYENSVAAGLWEVIASRIPQGADRRWFAAASEVPSESPFHYPALSRPAAFLCAKGRCSVPLFTVAELSARIDDMLNGAR